MGKIAMVFAGQGAQYHGMGFDLYNLSCGARGVYKKGEEQRKGSLELCFESPKEVLNLTQNAQPSLFLTDLACSAALAEDYAITPDMVAGFSLGEIPALCYAGVLSFKEAFDLVFLRGYKMAECALKYPGGMAAVLRLEVAEIEKLCAEYGVYPVNYNCSTQTVCAGKTEPLERFCAAVKEAGGRTVPLAVSGAFHTPYMQEASDALKEFLAKADIHAPELPIYSNKTALPYPEDRDGIAALISEQVVNGVRWEQTVRNMATDGADTFIEVGAGKTLSGLIARIVPKANIYHVGDIQSLKETAEALADGWRN